MSTRWGLTRRKWFRLLRLQDQTTCARLLPAHVLQLVHLYAERGSPKYEKAAMRWLERCLTEGSPRLLHFAEVTAELAKLAVDWNEQAAKKAQEYLNTQSFSRSGLMEQLLYEGFTQAQASYGVSIAY